MAPGPRAPSDPAVPSYIAEFCTELIEMAEAAHLDLLGYLLRVARTEAQLVSNRVPDR